jgi:hypothetical protein
LHPGSNSRFLWVSSQPDQRMFVNF